MKRRLYSLLLVFALLLGCDDGDIITVTFDFPEEFTYCGNLVLYKIRKDPLETLSIRLTSPAVSFEDLLGVDEDGNFSLEWVIDGSSNMLNYRRYKGETDAPLFCNAIPNSDVTIISDESSTTGIVTISTVLHKDDNDGIPPQFEDINANKNLDDDDTDADGLPNYLDDDDDGDNVPTTGEKPNFDTVKALTEALDTDQDGTPNYLDTDDDNDSVLTRDEENATQDQNPTNDFTASNDLADYLNPLQNTTVKATTYRTHTILETYIISLTVKNVQFSNITQDVLDFGTLTHKKTATVTPTFNE